MGHVQEKYTREYFLKQDEKGNKVDIGAEGVEEFMLGGRPRPHDKIILEKIDFKNKRVLDFGFGRGEAMKYAFENGAKQVYGTDFSKASFEIASAFLSHYGYKPCLECSDALEFAKKFALSKQKIDIIIMFDFVEHIPRKEFGELLKIVKKVMAPKGLLVINTPIFKVDNDLIAEGLKPEARDSSDESPLTAGMHCNRYTKKSLVCFMRSLGFRDISPKFFTADFDGYLLLPSVVKWNIAKKNSYPIAGKYKKDIFEISTTTKEARKIALRRRLSFRTVLPLLLPHGLYLWKSLISPAKKTSPYTYRPVWHRIKGGILRGRWIYLDTHDRSWQTEIIEGVYDKFFFDFLKGLDLKGKTIYDVGAFIGSHTLAFAQLVGPQGKVYAFEPNKFNLERMKLIFGKNKELKKRIRVMNIALGDRNAKVKFNFSSQIDNGFSSGGFVQGSNTPRDSANYGKNFFKPCQVRSVKLDDLEKEVSSISAPDIIKLDVEGAEGRILESGKRFLKNYHPIILVEIHSPENMISSLKVFFELNYKIEILNKEKDGRVFLVAIPQKK